MTARPEERDRPYKTAEETDEMDAKETDAMDAKETDVTDVTDAKEMDTLTTRLATSNDLRGLPPSARR